MECLRLNLHFSRFNEDCSIIIPNIRRLILLMEQFRITPFKLKNLRENGKNNFFTFPSEIRL